MTATRTLSKPEFGRSASQIRALAQLPQFRGCARVFKYLKPRVGTTLGAPREACGVVRASGDRGAAARALGRDRGHDAAQSQFAAGRRRRRQDELSQEKTGFQSEREHVCGRPRALRRCG